MTEDYLYTLSYKYSYRCNNGIVVRNITVKYILLLKIIENMSMLLQLDRIIVAIPTNIFQNL